MKPVIIGDCELIGFPDKIVIYAICGEHTVYVGSARYIRSRIKTHIRSSKEGSNLPIHKWMRDKEFKFSVTFLEEVDGCDREKTERKWIETLKGNLLNLTNGGPGMSGYYYSGTEQKE